MRTLLLIPLLAAAACGGNFSNDDLEYLAALPTKEALASRLPESEQTSGALVQRVNPLGALGEPAELYSRSRGVAEFFNRTLDTLLALLERIRDLPPTTRAPDERVWGPFLDRKQPGHELRVRMTRDGALFRYALEIRARASQDDWWPFLSGEFKAAGGIRKGEGTVSLFPGEARARGIATPDLEQLDEMHMGYQTQVAPTLVTMIWHGSALAGFERLEYFYREPLDPAPGGMRFTFSGAQLVGLPGSAVETFEVASTWQRSGRGRSDSTIRAGDLSGAFATECWNDARLLTYGRDYNGTEVGLASTCAPSFQEAFPP